MLTLDSLKAFGANVDEGMTRCFNNEAFYLRLIGMGLEDENFGRLKAAIDAGDAAGGFEAAHALKGAIGNLALTPIYEPVCAVTEALRGGGAITDEARRQAALALDRLDALRRLAE